MKQSAIICEYNALHNGHIRLIQHAKAHSHHLVCIMSGNFTQRGMPAVANKYVRAKHAILAGASVVVELPTLSATSSAEEFARGAISIANSLGVDKLFFGSELGDTEQLISCANTLLSGHSDNTVRQLLDQGLSYPRAVSQAYPQYSTILDQPNNVLALEYIKQIISTNSNITPHTLHRTDSYNNSTLQGQYASATAIRANLHSSDVANYLPQYVLDDISLDAENNYCQYLPKHIATMSPESLNNIYGAVEGLGNKIYNSASNCNYCQLVAAIKSKRYTQLRIQRLLLHCTLGVTTEQFAHYKANMPPIRILAIDKSCAPLLLSHYASIGAEINTCDTLEHSVDRRADRLYNSLTNQTMPFSMTKI